MKHKLIIALLAVAFLITGCSKDSSKPVLNETLYPVIFNVSTFSSEIAPIGGPKTSSILPKRSQLLASSVKEGKSTTPLEGEIRYLSYYIMNDAGKIVLQRSIDRENLPESQTTFGRIEASLPAGSYSFMILGTNGGVSFGGEGQSSFLSNYNNFEKIDFGFSDVFFKLVKISVGDQAIEESVALERIVGKLEIKLQDEVPSDISQIEYSISEISTFFYPFNISDSQLGGFKRTALKGQHDFTENLYLYFFYQNAATNNSGYATVNIRAYNDRGELKADKVVKNVPVGVNQKTVLTGKLFSDPETPGQGFTVSVNSDWESINDVDF